MKISFNAKRISTRLWMMVAVSIVALVCVGFFWHVDDAHGAGHAGVGHG